MKKSSFAERFPRLSRIMGFEQFLARLLALKEAAAKFAEGQFALLCKPPAPARPKKRVWTFWPELEALDPRIMPSAIGFVTATYYFQPDTAPDAAQAAVYRDSTSGADSVNYAVTLDGSDDPSTGTANFADGQANAYVPIPVESTYGSGTLYQMSLSTVSDSDWIDYDHEGGGYAGASAVIFGEWDGPVAAPDIDASGSATPESTALALSALSMSDSNASNGGLQVEFTVGNGTLSVLSSSGNMIVDGSGSSSVMLTDLLTDSDVAAVLGGDDLVYTPNSNYTGTDSLTIAASDIASGANSLATVSIDVNPIQLSLTAPSSTSAGSPFNVTVTAQDSLSDVASGYTGTVHFSQSDSGSGSALPSDYTFTSADAGTHVFSVTAVTAGTDTITATDTADNSITGSATLSVTPGSAANLTVSAPAGVTTGAPFSFSVTARDSYDNVVTGYTGTIHFSSSDTSATLPANAVLTAGGGVFDGTLNTMGSQAITATDTVSFGITGSSQHDSQPGLAGDQPDAHYHRIHRHIQ